MSVASLLALLVAECAIRIALPPPPRVMVMASYDKGPLGDAGDPIVRHALARTPEEGFIYVPTATGRRLRPNSRVVIRVVIENNILGGRTIEIATNSLGYRNREIGPKHGTRLLFLGDSITFGDYLHEEETFVRIVEGLAATDERAWETINAGVGGVSLANELAILEETGLSLLPDAVVVCYYLNDYHESPGVIIQNVPKPLAGSRLASHQWFALPRLLALPAGLFRPASDRPDMAAWRTEYAGRTDGGEVPHAVVNAFGDWGGAWSPHS